MGTFGERVQVLIDEVGGGGKLVGRVVVDQPYAQDQHETLAYQHKGGGKARYLGDPLFQSANTYMVKMAASVLNGGLVDAMISNMEDLAGDVFKQAPFEFGDLKASGHPIVKSGNAIVYDRPPLAGRLRADGMAVKQELRNLGFGHNSWRNTN